jgi:hypothetical protein
MTKVRPAAATSASLWERDKEVAAIERVVDTLCADRSSSGRVHLLRGDAGLGKTALLAETRRIAEARGCTVWSARGGETLRSVPFNVVRQLLQPALLSLHPEEAREYSSPRCCPCTRRRPANTSATGTTSPAPPSASRNPVRAPPTRRACATASSPP